MKKLTCVKFKRCFFRWTLLLLLIVGFFCCALSCFALFACLTHTRLIFNWFSLLIPYSLFNFANNILRSIHLFFFRAYTHIYTHIHTHARTHRQGNNFIRGRFSFAFLLRFFTQQKCLINLQCFYKFSPPHSVYIHMYIYNKNNAYNCQIYFAHFSPTMLK